MTTERDVYEIDTTLAVKNLQALYDSQLRMEKLMRDSVSPALNEQVEGQNKLGTAAIALGNILGNLATQALHMVWSELKSGVVAAAEAERAYRQLKVVAGQYTDALDAQAEALEKQTGASGESLKAVAAMLLRFGVAPADIDKTTRAMLNFATATGVDVLDATRKVTMAVENGGSKLETLGIEFEGTGKAAKDMAIAVEGLTKKFGGATEAEADTLYGHAQKTQVAFEDLKKAFGGLVIEFEAELGLLAKLSDAFNGLRQALFGFDRADHYAELDDLNKQLVDKAAQIEEIKKNINEREELNLDIAHEMLELQAESLQLEYIRAQIRKNQGNPLEAPGAGKPLGGKDRETKAGKEAREKAEEEARKDRERELKAHEDAMNKSVEIEKRRYAYEKQFKEEADKLAKDKEEKEKKRLEGMSALRKQQFEIDKANMEAHNAELMALENARVSAMEASWGKVTSFAADAANQIVSHFAKSIEAFLTTNQVISGQIQEAEIKARQAQLAEQGIIKTTGELRVEAENERKAAEQERLAQTLANIAIEAGKNALFQGAEAIGAAAGLPFTAGKMAAHIAAAAAFATIAGGAGAAAFGITQSRGATRSEREQIENIGRSDKKSKDAEKASLAAGKTVDGTVLNVYYLGITGQTTAEQGKELDRIQREYGDMRTGGK